MMTDATAAEQASAAGDAEPALTFAGVLPALLEKAGPLFVSWRDLDAEATARGKNPRRMMDVQRAEAAYDAAVEMTGAVLMAYSTLPTFADAAARDAYVRRVLDRVRAGVRDYVASGLTGAEYVARQQQAKRDQAAPAGAVAAGAPAGAKRHYVVVGHDVNGAPEEIAVFGVTGEGATVGAWASSPVFTLVGGIGWNGNIGDNGQRYESTAAADSAMRVAAREYLTQARVHAMDSGRYATRELVEASYYIDERVPDPTAPSGWVTVAGGPPVAERHYTVVGTDADGAREDIGVFAVTGEDGTATGYTSSPTFTRAGGVRMAGNVGTGPHTYPDHARANGAMYSAATAYLRQAREHAATTGRYAGPEQIAAAYRIEVHVQDSTAPGRFVRLGGSAEAVSAPTTAV